MGKGEKTLKLPFIIYADLECLLEKISTCYNDSNISLTTKINRHTPIRLFNLYKLHI